MKVVELRKKDKSIRQIAKAVKMSFSEIGEILREIFPEKEIKPIYKYLTCHLSMYF